MEPHLVPHHHYCVVETREAGRPVLTTVPYQWISDKFLLWPSKNAEAMRKDVASKPSASWAKMPCKVKRRFIPTFFQAEQEVAEMSGVNTDSDIGQVPVVKKSRKKAPKVETQGMDFNSYFTTNDPVTNPTSDITFSSVNSTNLPLVPEVLIETREDMGSSSVVAPSQRVTWEGHQHEGTNQQPQVTQQQPEAEEPQQQGDGISNVCDYVLNMETFDSERMKLEIFEKIDAAKSEIADTVTKRVETLLVKSVAAMRCDFDAKIELSQQCKCSSTSGETPRFLFSPMTSIQELQELEHNLEDEEYARKLMKHMKQLIGTTGDQYNGQNVCYELVDKFFDRKLLTQCSWTGQSRSETPKFAIQNCKNLLNLLFSIVKSVNEHFSEKALFDFLKSITRNSKKRSEAKLLRQSTVKRRRRKNPGVIQHESDDEPNDETNESPALLNQSVAVPNRSAVVLNQSDVLNNPPRISINSSTREPTESAAGSNQYGVLMHQIAGGSNQIGTLLNQYAGGRNTFADFNLRVMPTMQGEGSSRSSDCESDVPE